MPAIVRRVPSTSTMTIGFSSDDGSAHSKTCVTSPMIDNTEDARSARSKMKLAGTKDPLESIEGQSCSVRGSDLPLGIAARLCRRAEVG